MAHPVFPKKATSQREKDRLMTVQISEPSDTGKTRGCLFVDNLPRHTQKTDCQCGS